MIKIKEVIKVKIIGTSCESIYTADKVLCAIVCPDDADFNGKTVQLKAGIREAGSIFPVYDRTGSSDPIVLGAQRYVFLDLIDLAGAVYIKLEFSANLNGKEVELVLRKLNY